MKKKDFRGKIEVVNNNTQKRDLVCMFVSLGDGINIIRALNATLSENSELTYILTTI